MRKVLVLLTAALCGCTTNYPIAVGTLGGAAAGAGIGALAGDASSTISVGEGVAIGAGAGIPIGIGLAYASDAYAKHSVLSDNEDAIVANHDRIVFNQAQLQAYREEVMAENPRSQPDADLAEYIFLGPTLGNAWR